MTSRTVRHPPIMYKQIVSRNKTSRTSHSHKCWLKQGVFFFFFFLPTTKASFRFTYTLPALLQFPRFRLESRCRFKVPFVNVLLGEGRRTRVIHKLLPCVRTLNSIVNLPFVTLVCVVAGIEPLWSITHKT